MKHVPLSPRTFDEFVEKVWPRMAPIGSTPTDTIVVGDYEFERDEDVEVAEDADRQTIRLGPNAFEQLAAALGLELADCDAFDTHALRVVRDLDVSIEIPNAKAHGKFHRQIADAWDNHEARMMTLEDKLEQMEQQALPLSNLWDHVTKLEHRVTKLNEELSIVAALRMPPPDIAPDVQLTADDKLANYEAKALSSFHEIFASISRLEKSEASTLQRMRAIERKFRKFKRKLLNWIGE